MSRNVLKMGELLKVYAFIVEHEASFLEQKVSLESAAFMCTKELGFEVVPKNLKTLVAQSDVIKWAGARNGRGGDNRARLKGDIAILAAEIVRLHEKDGVRPFQRTRELAEELQP